MTEDDKAVRKEVLKRSGVVGMVVGLLILFRAFLSYKQDPPIESQSTKVVGEYKGCDIVRWNSHEFAEYKYFLYCEDK